MRSVTRWIGRRWCWARHRGELWKKQSTGPNHVQWYCRNLRTFVDDCTVVTTRHKMFGYLVSATPQRAGWPPGKSHIPSDFVVRS